MWFQFECVLNMYQVRNPCSEMSVEPMDAMKMGFMYRVHCSESDTLSHDSRRRENHTFVSKAKFVIGNCPSQSFYTIS